jgi:soluble lytic murein transglycosylase-like protein
VEFWRSLVKKHWPDDRVDCVLGIIKKESRGDPRARNTTHDTRGLMQHLIKYWSGRARGAGFVDGNGLVADPYNGEANIAAGAYLANYYDEQGKNWWRPWGNLPSYGSCSG